MKAETASEVAEWERKVDDVHHAFSNPVLRTYMHGRGVHAPCLVMVLGVVLVVTGPLLGSVLKASIETSIHARQTIDNSTSCFTQQSNPQQCSGDIAVDITFFTVQNLDAVTAGTHFPILQENGPYHFTAKEVHSAVDYLNIDAVQFEQRSLELVQECDTCDWTTEITVLYKDAVKTGTPVELATELTQRETTHVTLDTGATDAAAVYDVLSYGVDVLPMRWKYEGALFGDAFSSEAAATVFDPWLEATVSLSWVTATERIRGLDAAQLRLVEDGTTWDAAGTGVLYSLPFLHGGNDSSLTSDGIYDAELHGWEFLVDRHFGFTLSRVTAYQGNHRMEVFGGEAFWTASHWMRVTALATDSDVAFVKNTLKKQHLVFYLCDVGMMLCGCMAVVAACGWLFCSPAARKRWMTIEMLSRSRARDPKLNPSQFKSIGKFLQSQMRRKRCTQSTDSGPGGPTKTPQTSSQTRTNEFDDVRCIPNPV